MKSYTFIFLCGFIFCAKAQILLPPTVLPPVSFSSGTTILSYPCIQSQEEATNNANRTYRAENKIELSPPFMAHNFTSTGRFHAMIQNDYHVASMSSSGWTVNKYDKLELGVSIPSSFKQQINDFFTTGTGLNPYDPDQIKLTCTFSYPNGASYSRDAFFYRDMQIVNGLWQEVATDYSFRVRFCPPMVGVCTAVFSLTVNGVTQNPPVYSYAVTVNSSNNKGFLSVDPSTTRKFKFDDGTPFFAVGQNLMAFGDDPHLSPDTPYCSGPCLSPSVYNLHRSFITDLSNHGGNFTRVRIDENFYPVEYYELNSYPYTKPYSGSTYTDTVKYPPQYFKNNYDNNQKHMWELDKTVSLMESKGMYFLLCLLEDQCFSTYCPYSNSSHPIDWTHNPYSDPNATNIILDNQGFFTNTSSKNTFKKYLAYINARWGYSTNIAAFELVNETWNVATQCNAPLDANGKCDESSTARPYIYDINFYNSLNSWVCEMSSALKSKYPSHLVTTGPTNRTDAICATDPQSCTNGAHDITCLDIIIQNSYPAYSSNNAYYNQEYVRHSQAKARFDLNRPFIWGELGQPDGVNIIDAVSDRTFHNANWVSIISGAIGTGMYWNDFNQSRNVNHRANFDAMKVFSDNVDWTKPWLPNSLWGDRDGVTVGNKTLYTFSTVDLQTKKAIGFALNNSSNFTNDPDFISQFPIGSTSYNDLLGKIYISPSLVTGPYDINPSIDPNNNPYVYIEGTGAVPGTQFKITIYNTRGTGGVNSVIYNSVGSDGIIRFPLDMPFNISNNGSPDYAFIAEPVLGQRQGNPISESTDGIIGSRNLYNNLLNAKVYPNPTSNRIYVLGNNLKGVQISIHNLLGEEVIPYINIPQEGIDISHLSDGTYFYTIKLVDGTVKKDKLIIIK